MARILAVDDERAILDALARVLGRDGHEVVKAADPTAVPGTDLSRFDLVLCDVMMPGLDGFELVRQIRPDFDGPIIFLTARVAEEDAVAGYGLGADDYVRKPFGAAELRAKVAAHLRRERRPRSHALSFGEVRIDLGARGGGRGGGGGGPPPPPPPRRRGDAPPPPGRGGAAARAPPPSLGGWWVAPGGRGAAGGGGRPRRSRPPSTPSASTSPATPGRS